MTVYTYAENLNPRESFTQIEFFRDNGEKVILIRGLAYDLTASEVDKVRSRIRLNVGGSPVYAPTVVPNSAEIDAIIAQAVAQAISSISGGLAVDIASLETISVAGSFRGDVAPSDPGMLSNAGRTLATNGSTWLLRFAPQRAWNITLARWEVTTAATVDDAVEVAVYNSNLSSRLATSGAQTGQLNATGIKGVGLTYTFDPSLVYYIAFRYAVGGTGATVQGRGGVNGTTWATMFGTSVPTAIAGFVNGLSSPLPASITAGSVTWTGVGAVPMIVLREV